MKSTNWHWRRVYRDRRAAHRGPAKPPPTAGRGRHPDEQARIEANLARYQELAAQGRPLGERRSQDD